MSDQISDLKKQGFSVIEMNQSVDGTAYQKLDNKIMGLVSRGLTKIAVVTNVDNPHMSDMVRIADRANHIISGADVSVHSSDVVMRTKETVECQEQE